VSGHDEFELARQAIRVGVDNYLLKPVAGKDLFDALHKASEQITEHKRQSVSFLKDASDEETVKNALVSTLLEQLCSGEISADETLRRSGELGIDILGNRYAVLVCLFERKGGYPNRQTIVSKVKFMLVDDPDVLYFLSGVDNVVLIIKGSADIEVTEKAYHAAQTLKHEIEDDGATTLTVSISSVTGRISSIRDAFHEACILLKTFGQAKRGRIFCAGDIGRIDAPGTASADSFFNVNIENRLKFAVAEDVPAIVEEFTKNLDTDEMQSVLYRYYILMDLTNTAMRIIRNFNPRRGKRRNRQALRGSQAAVPVRHISPGIHGSGHPDLPEDHRAEEQRQRQPPREAGPRRLRIHPEELQQPRHLAEQRRRPRIPDPAHFSTIFAQEMSTTFIDYLTNVRMEKVKEMLASTDEKIVNIAFAVGYNEPNYLSYLFKKREGITLKEYRQRKRPQGAK
jgi:two-component system response regulator YesN